jgi:hypothetical protein
MDKARMEKWKILAESAAEVEARLGAARGSLEAALGCKKAAEMMEGVQRTVAEMRRKAQEVASGADERRKAPMVAALQRAQSGGTSADMVEAMAEVANVALGEDRPMWYAAAVLDSVGVDMEKMGAEAAKALFCPLDSERSLGGSGYCWEWPSAATPSQWERWKRVARLSGAIE